MSDIFFFFSFSVRKVFVIYRHMRIIVFLMHDGAISPPDEDGIKEGLLLAISCAPITSFLHFEGIPRVREWKLNQAR